MKHLFKNRSRIIATGLGIGYIPIAPGTFASLFALIVFLLIPLESDSFFQFPIVLLLFAVGLWSSGSLSVSEDKDPSIVVIDEITGMWISCMFLPKNSIWIVMAFLLFRFFDITKIGGIKRLEKIPGGLGVMLDDVFAGLLVCVILNFAIFSDKFLFWS